MISIKGIGWGALDLFAAFFVAHAAVYAFTGQSLVTPLNFNDGYVRFVLLFAMHIGVPMAAVLRRI